MTANVALADAIASQMVIIRVKRDHPDLPLPDYATPQSSGMDLRAAESLLLLPGQIATVGTGLHIELPEGCEAQIRPRSGLALKHGISLPNAPGTIDADYRGEIRVILINMSHESFQIQPGDRIAQMVIVPVLKAELIESEELGSSSRGEGGFGSTGKR